MGGRAGGWNRAGGGLLTRISLSLTLIPPTCPPTPSPTQLQRDAPLSRLTLTQSLTQRDAPLSRFECLHEPRKHPLLISTKYTRTTATNPAMTTGGVATATTTTTATAVAVMS